MPRRASDLDIDFSLDRRWQWPAWKFSLDQVEVQTTLHARFNSLSTQLPLQDLEAFHHDVSEMAHRAPEDDVAAFHALLAARRDQREGELERSWASVSQRLAASPQSFASPEQWRRFCQFSRTFSLDSLVAFAASFLDTTINGCATPQSPLTPPAIADNGPPTPPTPPTADASEKKAQPGRPDNSGRVRHRKSPSRRLPVPDQPEVVEDKEARDIAVDGGRGSPSRTLEQTVGQAQGLPRPPPDATLPSHDRDTHRRHRLPSATHTKHSTRPRPPVLTGRVQTIRPGRVRQGKRKLDRKLVDS